MKALTTDEAKEWCSNETTGLKLTHDGELRYQRPGEHRFFITAPEEHRDIVVLTRDILLFRGEENFSGGLLWLHRWDIGTPNW